jgi:hypothetical protein
MLSCFLTSCGSQKKASRPATPPRPAWLEQRPQPSGYYVGIGSADKQAYPLEYQQIAKRKALSDLASEIEVTVDARSMLYRIDEGGRFRSQYRSATQLQARQSLEGYQRVDNWEDDNSFWVYYRLSQSQYRQQLAQARDKAAQVALSLFRQGQELEASGRFADAMGLYLQALTELEAYLGEPIEVSEGGTSLRLGDACYDALTELVGQTALRFAPPEVAVRSGDRPDRPLSRLQLTARARPVPQARLQWRPAEGRAMPIQTDAEGQWPYHPEVVARAPGRYQHRAVFRLKALAELDWEAHPLANRLVERLPTPSATLSVSVSPPDCRIRIEGAWSQGQPSLRSGVEAAVQQAGMQPIARAPAAYLLTLEVSERDGPVNEGIHVRYLDLRWRLSEGGRVVTQGQINGVKGVQLKAEDARRQAYQNSPEALEDALRPALRRWLRGE